MSSLGWGFRPGREEGGPKETRPGGYGPEEGSLTGSGLRAADEPLVRSSVGGGETSLVLPRGKPLDFSGEGPS